MSVKENRKLGAFSDEMFDQGKIDCASDMLAEDLIRHTMPWYVLGSPRIKHTRKTIMPQQSPRLPQKSPNATSESRKLRNFGICALCNSP